MSLVPVRPSFNQRVTRTDPRQIMGQTLLQSAVDTSPVRSQTEGIARLGKALIAGATLYKMQKDDEAKEASFNAAMENAFKASKAKDWVVPENTPVHNAQTGEVMTPEQLQAVNFGKAGGMEGFTHALMTSDNTDARAIGLNLLGERMIKDDDDVRDVVKERRKWALKIENEPKVIEANAGPQADAAARTEQAKAPYQNRAPYEVEEGDQKVTYRDIWDAEKKAYVKTRLGSGPRWNPDIDRDVKQVNGGLFRLSTREWITPPRNANTIRNVGGGLFDLEARDWIVPPTNGNTTKVVNGGLYDIPNRTWIIEPKGEKETWSHLKSVGGGLYNGRDSKWEVEPPENLKKDLMPVGGGIMNIRTKEWLVEPKEDLKKDLLTVGGGVLNVRSNEWLVEPPENVKKNLMSVNGGIFNVAEEKWVVEPKGEKPEPTEAWMIPGLGSRISFDRGRNYMDMDGTIKPMPANAHKRGVEAGAAQAAQDAVQAQAQGRLDANGPPGSSMPTGIDPAAATGGSGVLGNIGNVLSGMVGGELVAPNVEKAGNALKQLEVATQVGLQDAFPGRPSNYLVELAGGLTITPHSFLQGDASAREKVQQLRTMIDQSIKRIDQHLATSTLTREAMSNFQTKRMQLEGLKKDYDVIAAGFENSRPKGKVPTNTGTVPATDASKMSDDEIKRALGILDGGSTPTTP